MDNFLPIAIIFLFIAVPPSIIFTIHTPVKSVNDFVVNVCAVLMLVTEIALFVRNFDGIHIN